MKPGLILCALLGSIAWAGLASAQSPPGNALPVTVESGTIFLDDRPFGPAAGEADGPRTLAFRPHDVAVGDSDAPGIAGIVVSELRHGATRRLAVETGMKRHRIEIDVAADAATKKGQRVVLHPQRWRLFAENEYGAFR